ncbi:Peptidase S10 serine carboxypeptidase [Imperialibacter sp. EC-SDR9]|nr:Carboxypeptidase [Imperialibacter sp. 75]CAD5294178.1 Carboxypeptidase [Imperialibacter sp. 89]VVT12629.1 Peptidase S10 serine carboxypeptidase [Imperialibacter sp. EC-SDR9]
MMKKILLRSLLLIFCAVSVARAQEKATAMPERTLPAESAVTTTHEVTIKGKRIPYKATAGTQPVWSEDGKVIASMFYTYYERTDITNKANRPLVISFNGGPGSASVWMHIAYTGPVVLNIDSEGYPLQPYGVKENPNSILDVADIVYIDPVNTGFSRILDPKAEKSVFFGVNADIKYLADWLDVFVSRVSRWSSPKYIIGESYGTTRVSGLALELQNAHWMYFNGVILVSPTGLGIDRDGPVHDALYLPYYAATAWYHKMLPADLQAKDLDDILPEVEAYTIDEVIPAMTRGGFITEAKRKVVAAKMSRYSGIKESVLLQHNLAIPTNFYWKELLRDQGMTIGRLDSRYKGIDRQDAGDSRDYDPALTMWNHEFAPAINYYLRDVLKFKTDLQYNLFGPVHPWDRSGDQTGENLRQAMAQNPYMHVMIQSGYYDGGTDYFNAKYSMWQMDPSGKLKDRLRWEGYRSGHMMYLRAEDLVTSNDHIRDFIQKSLPGPSKPAKY